MFEAALFEQFQLLRALQEDFEQCQLAHSVFNLFKSFELAMLAPHAKQHVRFVMHVHAFSTVDAEGIRAGDYNVHRGGLQPNESPDKSVADAINVHTNKELAQ